MIRKLLLVTACERKYFGQIYPSLSENHKVQLDQKGYNQLSVIHQNILYVCDSFKKVEIKEICSSHKTYLEVEVNSRVKWNIAVQQVNDALLSS